MKHRKSDSRLNRTRTLDVSLAQDPRNELYRMQTVLPSKAELKSKRWPCKFRLDQGAEGACVGFAGAHKYGASPDPQFVSTSTALRFYHGAQLHDEWTGEQYEGTSVTGLMRWLKSQGACQEYRWIRTAEELVATIALHGPVIVGCEWREGCFTPDSNGLIQFIGAVRGGHATCWDEVDFERQRLGIIQSWGKGHGINGRVYMSFADVDLLLRTNPSIVLPAKLKLTLPKPKPTKRSRWWQFWK